MRIIIVITALSIAGLLIFWQPNTQILFWSESSANSNNSYSGANNSLPEPSNSTNHASIKEGNSTQYDGRRNAAIKTFIPNPEAVASLRQARLEGDSRTPNLAPNHEREQPSAEALVDHEQYLEYERRQQKRVYRAYVEASKIKTTQLRSMIEQGKAEDVSDEDIAFAEEKIRGIEQMAMSLQQDYPDIMEDSYQPPADWLLENSGEDDGFIKSDHSAAKLHNN
jgi:hypothetical protein